MVIQTTPEQGEAQALLLARARAGDAEAFCELGSACEKRLFQQACGLTRDRFTAEDLVWETLTEAWRSLRRYDGTCRFSTWLFAILLHRFQKHTRARRSRPVSLASLPHAEAEDQCREQEKLASTDPSPADVAIQSEMAAHLRHAIESLPEKHRQVLLLRFFEDSPLAEIAAVMKCSVGTVKSRLHYALEKLRETAGRQNAP
jgi:RNA polymerase sigma-70 factor (ECF subfamily)